MINTDYTYDTHGNITGTAPKLSQPNTGVANPSPVAQTGVPATNVKPPSSPVVDASSVSVTNPKPQIPVGTAATQTAANVAPLMQGGQTAMQNLIDQQTQQEEIYKAKYDPLNQMASALSSKIGGLPGIQQQMESQAGVPGMKTQLQGIQNQIANLNASYQAGMTDIEGKPIPMQFITGQQAQLQRQYAVQVGALTAQAQALTGNMQAVEDSITQAVNVQSTALKAQYDDTIRMLNDNKDLMTTAQKEKADLQIKQVEEQQKQLDDNNTRIKDMVAAAAQAGAPSSLLTKAMSTGDPMETSKILGVYGGGLDAMYKRAEIAKIGQEMRLADAGTNSGQYGQSHAIAAGEDPYNIATSLGMTMQQLKDLNPRIKDWHNIPVGTNIKISPDWKTVYGNQKQQATLEKQYSDRLDKIVAARSGELGLQNGKVDQAIHLKALLDQYKDTEGNYNVPASQYEELAIGLANLVSSGNSATEGMRSGIMQRTAKGDIAGAFAYLTGTTPTGTTQDVLKNIADSIDRQGLVAENLRDKQMEYQKGLKPTDLDPFRAQQLEQAALPSFKATMPQDQSAGATASGNSYVVDTGKGKIVNNQGVTTDGVKFTIIP